MAGRNPLPSSAGREQIVEAMKFLQGGNCTLQLKALGVNTPGPPNGVAIGATGSDDAQLTLTQGATTWTLGIDQSDAGSWKLSNSGSLGTNDVLRALLAGLRALVPLGVQTPAPTNGLAVGASGSTDAQVTMLQGSTTWSTGIDQSDAGAWKLSSGAALGTNDILRAIPSELDVLVPVIVNLPGAAAVRGYIYLERGGVAKGLIGLDAADNLVLMTALGIPVARVESTFLLPSVPCVRAANSAGASIGSGLPFTSSVLPMTAAVYDTDTMYDAGNQRVKATRAGKYQITATALWGGNTGGTYRQTALYVNGTTVVTYEGDSSVAGQMGGSNIIHSLATTYALNAGDYVQVMTAHDAGVSLTNSGLITLDYVSL